MICGLYTNQRISSSKVEVNLTFHLIFTEIFVHERIEIYQNWQLVNTCWLKYWPHESSSKIEYFWILQFFCTIERWKDFGRWKLLWEKYKFLIFSFFSIIFTKFKIFLIHEFHIMISNPIVRLKIETPCCIMPKYLGSKSGNKVFYWYISYNFLKNARKMEDFQICVNKESDFHFYFP